MSIPVRTVLHTRALDVTIDGAAVLRDVSVDIVAGTCTALLGPNGSGKTTFLRAVLGLQPLANGDVEWFGQGLAQHRDVSRIALVPQMLPGSTSIPVSVAEFVESAFTSPLNRWTRWKLRRQRATSVAAALEAVGLAHKSQRSLETLSGGEQRRALFARALATSADVILLDEPLAGVDLEHQTELVAVLRSMVAAGRTLLIVAHELDAIAPLVDHVVILGGTGSSSIAYQGPPSSSVLGRHLHHDAHHEHELVPSDSGLLEL